jgi:Tfp pilus assembly protein PilV
LIEILVALSVLLIGMSGILALLSTGVALSRDGAHRADAALLVEDLLHAAVDSIRAREGTGSKDAANVRIERTPVPGRNDFNYEATFVRLPGEKERTSLVTLTISHFVRGRERTHRFGPYPVVIEQEFSRKVRAALAERQ